MKLAVGHLVENRYEVERVLGAGGTAIVYLVRDRSTDERYALKHLTISSSAIRERMMREGRVQQSIEHPNVIRMYEVLEVEGSPALRMEFVDGPSLEQALGRYRLTMGDAETLFQGVLAGVAAAHVAGLVHRDLKPANVLLSRTRDGFVPKLTDFGLAKLTDGDGPGHIGQTRSGIAMGTPSYMSPEQIRDARSVDRRADIWSLGCVLYELLTRQRAFPGDEALAIYNAIVDGEFIPVRRQLPDIPARLEQAIHGCLRVELEERIPDCDTLFAVLLGVKEWPLPENTLSALEKDTPTIRPAAVAPPLPRRAEYHPGGASGVGAGALGAGGTGITAASVDTALSPSMPPLRPVPLGAGLASEMPTALARSGDAATVILRNVDGTLVPHHPTPTPTPPGSPRTGWFVGGGLLAAGLLSALGVAAVASLLVVAWMLSPGAGPEAAPAPSVAQAAPREAPARPGEVGVAPVPAPSPAPAVPAAPTPAPRPAAPRDPRPPVSADPTRQVPDAGVPDKVEVRIGTVPYGASVHVGNHHGTGPFKVALTPSRHPVIVSYPGHDSFSQLIAVSVEGSNTWCFDLLAKQMTPTACP